MSRILAVIRRDFRHVSNNVIVLLVCVGLAFMPSLYAWFNIAGGWDPYGNTGQVKVALANSDEGLEGTVIPLHVNVGERVVTSLTGSTKIGYVVTSEDKAREGVASGEYYAAVVIPRDFTERLLSVASSDPTHPQLDYYVNQKRNAIASIVTNKASGSVKTMIDEGFTAAVSEAATSVMDDVSNFTSDDNVIGLASRLESALDKSSSSLRRASGDLGAYRSVLAAMRDVASSSDAVLGKNSLSVDAAQRLRDAASGVRDFKQSAGDASATVTGAIDRGSASVDDVRASIDNAFATADGDVDKLVSGLGQARDAASRARDGLQGLYDRLQTLEGAANDLASRVEAVHESSIVVERAHAVAGMCADLKARVGTAIASLDTLIQTIDSTTTDVETARTDAHASKDEIRRLADQAKADIEGVRSGIDSTLTTSLSDMADSIDNAANGAEGVATSLRGEIDRVSPMLDGATGGMAKLESTLQEAEGKLNAAADKVDALHDKARSAATSGDVNTLRQIFSADPSSLVDFLAAPVQLERTAIYPIENNGSAMTPYYTTMALWVGGTLLGILFYTGLSHAALEETRARPRHAYFGRLAFFLTVGFFQSTILLLGDLFFLGVQCVNPWLFMLTGWLASFVFINIIYSLATSFGDVGKAIGVLFMVIQVAGSGGTFPVQMLPAIFQKLYSFLPFVYSENAFRAAMFGTYGNDWLLSMGTLALYLVPALLLGLVLRKPLVGVNEWMEEKLEETKLM